MVRKSASPSCTLNSPSSPPSQRNSVMRKLLGLICMTLVIPAAGGCITYLADSNVFDGGNVRTLDGEMADLKLALNRGAITHEEYNRAESQLREEFKEGSVSASFTKELSPEQAEKLIAKSSRSARKPLIHSVDGNRGVAPAQ